MSECRERFERNIPFLPHVIIDDVLDVTVGRGWFAQLERPEVKAIVRQRMASCFMQMELDRKPKLLSDGSERQDIGKRKRLGGGKGRKALPYSE